MIRIWKALTDTGRIVVAGMLAFAALCLVFAVLTMCSGREKAAKARDAQTQAEGRTVSAVEAITEIGRLNERGAATDEEVRDAQIAIHQADPAERDRVARYRLCLLQQRADCDGLL